MKRIVVSSVITLFVLILALAGYYYSQKYAVIHSNPIDAIPTDAAWFIEIKNSKTGVDQLSKADFFKTISSDSSFKVITKSFHWLDSISKTDAVTNEIWLNQKLFISAHPTKANEFDFLYLCNLPRGKSDRDINSFIENLTDEKYLTSTREYEDVKIKELSIKNESVFTYAISKGVFIFSRTSFLVEDAIRQLKTGNSFAKTKTFSKTGIKFANDESILLFVNHFGLHDMLSGYISGDNPGLLESFNNICRWSRLSFRFEKNSIKFNGVSSSNDTTDLFSSIKGQMPSISRCASIAPARTAFLFDISVDNIEMCLNKLRSNDKFFYKQSETNLYIDSISKKYKIDLRKSMTAWNKQEVALLITEPGSLNLENNTYALIKAENSGNALQSLEKLQSAIGKTRANEKYRTHQIANINMNSLVSLFYGNMFLDIQSTYYTNIKDFIIFANNPGILKSLIDDYEDKKVLEKETDYLSHVENSLLSSQLNIYFNLQRGTNILRSISNEDISSKLINDGIFKKTIQSVALSFNSKNDLVTSVGRVDFSGKITRDIRLLWSTQLDTLPLTDPFVIVNGENRFIAIQDQNNILNFFNESGKLLWKKPIGEKILSEIYGVDQYNNGECQIVFNTPSKLFLLDINGDSIIKFPIRLPSMATNGLLLKDFDGNNRPELYVACNNGTIYGYGISGKPLTQFVTHQSFFGITNQFIPFKFKNTDYILASGETNLYIIDRKGKIVRLKTPEGIIKETAIAYSDSGSKCSIMILNNAGDLYSIDPNKTAEINDLNLDVKFDYLATTENNPDDKITLLSENKLYTFSEDDKLVLRSELKSGSRFKIVKQLQSRNRIGISEISTTKFYMLSQSSKTEDGYPVWGSSNFCIMPGSDNLIQSYIVICDSNGVLYVYSE